MGLETRVFPITLRRTFGALPEVYRVTWDDPSDLSVVQLYEAHLGLALKSPTRPDEKPPDLPLVAFGAYDQIDRRGPGCRGSNLNPEGVHCIALDYDDIEPATAGDVLTRAKAFSVRGLAHTTWQHGLRAGVRMRVVLPLPEPVPAVAWPEIWGTVNYTLGGIADPQTKNIDRFWYLPAVNLDAPAWARDGGRVWFECWGA